jgi:hypothetical protein
MVVKATVTLAICSGGNRRDVGWRRHDADPRFVLRTRDMDGESVCPRRTGRGTEFALASFRVR